VFTVIIAAAALTGLGIPSAAAEGHQFRGHIDTTATQAGPTAPVLIEGSGVISGLGVTTVSGSEVVNPANGTITGSANFTAASGDTLTFAWSDVPLAGAPPAITFGGEMAVQGGTGRLADRVGTVMFTGGFDFTTGQGWFDVTGSLGG
jgi:hypothetical protein